VKWLGPAALGILGGAVAGGAVATLLNREAPSKPAATAGTPRGEPRPAITVISNDGVEHRVEELERRLRERSLDGSPAPEEADGRKPTERRHLETPEAANSAVVERHRQWRDEHLAEPRSGAWAARQEAAVRTALGDVIEHGGFSIVGVDCRTKWCRADVEWPDYVSALKGSGRVLRSGLDGCESAMLLEPPADDTRPYAASAFFDCAPEDNAER
jgi:hypothetical protein